MLGCHPQVGHQDVGVLGHGLGSGSSGRKNRVLQSAALQPALGVCRLIALCIDERSTLTSDLQVAVSQGGFWLFTGWKNLFWARLKAWMIMALGELSPYMLWFCLSMRFKSRWRAIYIDERSTCRSLARRFFDFYGGKDSIPRVMLITPEPGIKWTIKICNKKGGSFHFEAVPFSPCWDHAAVVTGRT